MMGVGLGEMPLHIHTYTSCAGIPFPKTGNFFRSGSETGTKNQKIPFSGCLSRSGATLIYACLFSGTNALSARHPNRLLAIHPCAQSSGFKSIGAGQSAAIVPSFISTSIDQYNGSIINNNGCN